MMFAGKEADAPADVVYVASNAYWEKLLVLLPELPEGMCWKCMVNTWENGMAAPETVKGKFEIEPRSVKVFVAMAK